MPCLHPIHLYSWIMDPWLQGEGWSFRLLCHKAQGESWFSVNMVPVWGWGALLCVVLKAHHSPSQSLHRCTARSRGAGVIAQAFQHSAQLQPGSRWPALWLTVIIPERRAKWKGDGSWKLQRRPAQLYCWFVSTNAGLRSKKTSTLSVRSDVKVCPTPVLWVI